MHVSGHHHGHTEADTGIHNHDHSHGAIDSTLLTTENGIWAVKWSMVGLLLTAFLQAVVVVFTLGKDVVQKTLA